MRDARSHERPMKDIAFARLRLISRILNNSSWISYYVEYGNTRYLWNELQILGVGWFCVPLFAAWIYLFIVFTGFFVMS